MSWRRYRDAVRESDLSPGQRLYLLQLLLCTDFTDDELRPFVSPKQETLAEWCGAGIRSLRRYNRELEEAGWFTIERRPSPQTDRFHLHRPQDQPATMAGGSDTPPATMAGGQQIPPATMAPSPPATVAGGPYSRVEETTGRRGGPPHRPRWPVDAEAQQWGSDEPPEAPPALPLLLQEKARAMQLELPLLWAECRAHYEAHPPAAPIRNWPALFVKWASKEIRYAQERTRGRGRGGGGLFQDG